MTKHIDDEDVIEAMSAVDFVRYRRNERDIQRAEAALYHARKDNRVLRAKWRKKMRQANAPLKPE